MAEIDYFFEFSSEAAALADPIVLPLLSDPLSSRKNIWAFDLAGCPPAPPRLEPTPYWCMVAQTASNADLLGHPNLQFFLVTGALALYRNIGNGVFAAISINTFAARYAANWSFGLLTAAPALGPAIIDPSGNCIIDANGNALMANA